MAEVMIRREASKWHEGRMQLDGEEVASWSNNGLGPRAAVALVHEVLGQRNIAPSQAKWCHRNTAPEEPEDTYES